MPKQLWLLEVRADRLDTSPVVYSERFHGTLDAAAARLLAVIGAEPRADATPVM